MNGPNQRAQCPSAEQLTAFIEGTLTADRRRVITDHLAGCPDCREVWYMGADEHVSAPGVPRSQRMMWYLTAAAVVLLGLAALVWRTQGLWNGPAESDRLLAELVEASEGYRFTEGRLSQPFAWAPVPVITRSGDDRVEAPLAVQNVAVRLRELATRESSPAVQHGSGVALMAIGRWSDAVAPLAAAASTDGAPVAYRLDHAVALLEVARRSSDAAMAAEALNTLELVLAEDATNLSALFNKGVALEQIGATSAAVRAYEEYLVVDTSSAWAIEVRRRLQAARDRQQSARTEGAGPLFAEIDAALEAWAAASTAGHAPRSADWRGLASRLRAVSQDRRSLELVEAVEDSASWPSGRRACLASAISARAEWLSHYDNIRHAEALAEARSEARALACAGLPVAEADVHIALSRFALEGPAGLAHAQDVLASADSAGHIRAAGWLLTSMAVDAGRRGLLGTPGPWLLEASTRCKQASDVALCALVHSNIAEYHWALGDELQMWDHMKQSLLLEPAITGYRWRHVIASAVVGVSELTRLDGVMLRFASEMERAAVGWASPTGVVLATLRRADGLVRVHDDHNALLAVAEARRQIEKLPVDLRYRFLLDASYHEGRALMEQRPEAAIPPLTTAIDGFRQEQNAYRLASMLLDRGRAYMKTGQAEAAKSDWLEGVRLVEAQHVELRSRQARLKRTDRVWELFSELAVVHSGDPTQGLLFAERGRALAIEDGSAASPVGDQEWVPGNTAIMVYAMFGDRLMRWQISRGTISADVQRISPRDLEGLISARVSAIKNGEIPVRGRLEELLLPVGPAEESVRHLWIVPDGPLHPLPFAVLRTTSGDLLVEQFVVHYATSLASAQRATHRRIERASRPKALLVAAGSPVPVEGLPALPDAEREVLALASGPAGDNAVVLTGAAATPGRIRQAASSADIIHLAGHAITDMKRSTQSRLIVGGSPPVSVTAGEIAGWSLPRQPLVILSACDTASGRAYRGAGPDSLVSAFIEAGASSVVAAKWAVSDRDTRAFMVDFHQRLRRESPAEALAGAQRAAVASGIPPGTWAALVSIAAIDQ